MYTTPLSTLNFSTCVFFLSGINMQRAALTTRRRAFSQQALRRWEEVSNGRRASTVKPSMSKSLELDGRSYLLPTLTLAKVNGTDAKDSQQLFQARASNRPTPVVLDLHQVSSDGGLRRQRRGFSLKYRFNLLNSLFYIIFFLIIRLTALAVDQEA